MNLMNHLLAPMTITELIEWELRARSIALTYPDKLAECDTAITRIQAEITRRTGMRKDPRS